MVKSTKLAGLPKDFGCSALGGASKAVSLSPSSTTGRAGTPAQPRACSTNVIISRFLV